MKSRYRQRSALIYFCRKLRDAQAMRERNSQIKIELSVFLHISWEMKQ